MYGFPPRGPMHSGNNTRMPMKFLRHQCGTLPIETSRNLNNNMATWANRPIKISSTRIHRQQQQQQPITQAQAQNSLFALKEVHKACVYIVYMYIHIQYIYTYVGSHGLLQPPMCTISRAHRIDKQCNVMRDWLLTVAALQKKGSALYKKVAAGGLDCVGRLDL